MASHLDERNIGVSSRWHQMRLQLLCGCRVRLTLWSDNVRWNCFKSQFFVERNHDGAPTHARWCEINACAIQKLLNILLFFFDQEEFFFEESVHVFDNLNICHLPRNALNVSRFGLLHQRSHKHLSLLHPYLKIIAMDSSPSITK